jgi:hypothetical protein
MERLGKMRELESLRNYSKRLRFQALYLKRRVNIQKMKQTHLAGDVMTSFQKFFSKHSK